MYIGERVWIGENVTILPGACIGNGVVIGANSVVRGEIPNNVIIAGVPAKIVKKYNYERMQWGKNIVVISAVNFTTGGPFTVLKNVLTATKDRAECKFIALVHSSAELMELFPWVEFIEYPEVKSSWVKRLYFEYITCNRLSKVIKATSLGMLT